MVKMGKDVEKYNPIRLEDHIDFESKSNYKKSTVQGSDSKKKMSRTNYKETRYASTHKPRAE